MKKRTFFIFGIIFVSLTTLIFLAGCKKKSTSPAPQTQAVLKSMNASPPSIQLGDSCLVIATVTDQNDDLLANVEVEFSASSPSFGFFRNSSDLTDTLGIASSYFVTSATTDTGTVTLRATLPITGDIRNTTLYISYTPPPTGSIASIEFNSLQPSIQVKGTGGIESAVLVATGYDEYGRIIGPGHQIDFRILNGPGGGENLEPDTSITDELGQAFVTLNSGTISGTVELRAESDSIIYSNVTRLAINAGPPAFISLGADPLNIRGWDYVNVTSDVVAMVDDVYGNPVQDNTAVYFGTEEGMVDAYSLTSDGLSQTTYHSGDPRNDGLAYIYGSTSGGTVADTLLIIVSGPPNTITFLTYPASLSADGVDKGDVIVEVLDGNGNFVVNGTQVEMETDFGTCPSGATEDGINASLFETELTSQVLDRDYSPVSPDDGIGAVSYLTAKSGGVKDTVQVNFLTDLAYQKNCNLDIEGSVVYGGRAAINVEIKDRYGNPLGGHILTTSATQGTITNSTDTTNAFGESWKMVFNAPADTSIKSSTITITDQDPRGSWIILNKKVTLSAALKKK